MLERRKLEALVVFSFGTPAELDRDFPREWVRRIANSLPFLRFRQPVFHFSLSNSSPLTAHDFQSCKLASRIHEIPRCASFTLASPTRPLTYSTVTELDTLVAANPGERFEEPRVEIANLARSFA